MFYKQFFYWKNERIAYFLFFGERCDWIAQVTQKNERCERITHSRSFDLSKMSEFPALKKLEPLYMFALMYYYYFITSLLLNCSILRLKCY